MIIKFKIFESKSVKYKAGDYVLLDTKSIREKDEKRMKGVVFDDDDDYESVDILREYAKVYLLEDRDYSPIRVTFSAGGVYDIDDDDIIRFLTPEEIDEYNMIVNSKKYNI